MTEEAPRSSHFFGGFTLGVCVGAIGYYLLGTDEGRKVKNQIVREWHETRDELLKMGEVSLSRTKPISLRALMVAGLKELHVISQKTKIALPPPKVLIKAPAKPKRPRPAKKSELKFKGA